MKVLLLLPILLLLSAIPVHAQTIFQFPLHSNQSQNVNSSNSTVLNLNTDDIQNEIKNLQQKLMERKNFLATQLALKEQALLRPILAYDQIKGCTSDQHTPTNYHTYLYHFACGHVFVSSNGTVYRSFTLIANDYHLTGKPICITLDNPCVIWHAWMFNDSLPGPTMRMTVGDHVTVNLINAKDSGMAHGLHMHSIHSAYNDGVPGVSPGGLVLPGGNFTFNFVANPVGVFPYHCHMPSVIEHIMRGLYGMLIIDPITPRPPAKEMVMLLNGYSYDTQMLNGTSTFKPSHTCNYVQMLKNLTTCKEIASDSFEGDNQFYTVNGMSFGYDPMDNQGKGQAIHLNVGQHYRIYLVNMLELDKVNSFHMHGIMFYFTESGTFEGSIYTDILTLAQGDRGIIQFSFPFPGEYMFHSHINHFSELGWVGFFNVDNDHSYNYFK